MSSSPDAVGLISWNEFSENSAIEPSRRYGAQALRTLADLAIRNPRRSGISIPAHRLEPGRMDCGVWRLSLDSWS